MSRSSGRNSWDYFVRPLVNEAPVLWPLCNRTFCPYEAFRKALRRVKEQLRHIRSELPEDFPQDVRAFIDAHYLIVDDAAFSRPVISIIERERCNAEWALNLHCDHLIATFERIDDPYLRTRTDDIRHVVERLVRTLLEVEQQDTEVGPDDTRRDAIAVAMDLSPDEIAVLKGRGVVGIVTENVAEQPVEGALRVSGRVAGDVAHAIGMPWQGLAVFEADVRLRLEARRRAAASG